MINKNDKERSSAEQYSKGFLIEEQISESLHERRQRIPDDFPHHGLSVVPRIHACRELRKRRSHRFGAESVHRDHAAFSSISCG